MRKLLGTCILGALLTAGSAFAVEKAENAPKQAPNFKLNRVTTGAVIAKEHAVGSTAATVLPQQRQSLIGGDTCATPTVIAGLPYSDTGDTTGLADDYNEVCPFTATGAPDVVYVYTPAADGFIDISLCNSAYDTKLYVYEGACPDTGAPIGCSDDSCGLQSNLAGLAVTGGVDYYIIVDGYDSASFGSYTLDVTAGAAPVTTECPNDAIFTQEVDGPTTGWSASTSEASTPFAVFEDFSGVSEEIDGVIVYGIDAVPGFFGFIECDEIDPTFDVTFYADAGGVPGAVVCSETITGTFSSTGADYNGFLLKQLDLPLTTACGAGNGWVSVVGDGDPNCWFLWMSSGEVGNGSALQSDPNGGALAFVDYDFSLCLSGNGNPLIGACCNGDPNGCVDNVLGTDCPPGSRFAANTTCDALVPGCGEGACCFSDGTDCAILTEAACITAGGEWQGDAVSCDVCPFVLACPPGATLEGEPNCFDGYVDNFNGGCNSTPNVFSTIACGETICGKNGIYLADPNDPNSLVRDTDWYEYTIAGPNDEELSATLTTSFNADFFILSSPCATSTILASASVVAETPTTLTACLPAGTYYIFVGANTLGTPCGVDYNLSLDCAPCVLPRGACCPGDGSCIADQTATECDAIGGTWLGDGVACGPNNPCPQPPANDNCVTAEVITAPFSDTRDTSLATTSTSGHPGSCNSSTAITAGTMDNDIWFMWTPVEDCLATWVSAPSYDGLTVLYEGNDCNSLTELDCQDPAPETIQWTAIAGATYWIQQGDWGTSPGGGSVDLTLTCQPLTVTGACCLPDGNCVEVNALDCANANGVYQGDGTFCEEVSCPQPNPGDNCSVPLAITLDPNTTYSDPNQTTCGRVDDYEDTCMGFYDGGEDIIYEITVTADACFEFTVDADTIWAGAGLFSTCPDADPNACVALATSSANPDVFQAELTAGTYYLMIDTFPSPECATFDLTITPCAVGACCFTDGTCMNDMTEAGCTDLGGSFQGDGTLCEEVDCPIVPDDCDEALLISVPFSVLIDTSLATTSTSGHPGSCNTSTAISNGTMDNDVWYYWPADRDCLLRVVVDPITYDGITVVYEGADCNSLTELACEDEPEPHIIQVNAVAGTTYWFQSGDWGTSPGGGDCSIDITCVVCGDLDGDDDVDGDDFSAFLAAYGSSSGDAAYDLDADYDLDGDVDLVDYQTWIGCYRDFNGVPLFGGGVPVDGKNIGKVGKKAGNAVGVLP